MKQDILKFIKRVKNVFIVAELLILIAAMTLFGFAASGNGILFLPFAGCIVCFVALIVLYLAKVKYALVYELSFDGGVVNVKTKGGAYTFLPEQVEKVLYDKSRFILYIYKEAEREKFVLLRRVPLDRYRTEQFSAGEVAQFFPQLEKLNA